MTSRNPADTFFWATPLTRPPMGNGWEFVHAVASVSGYIDTDNRLEYSRNGDRVGGTSGSINSTMEAVWAAPRRWVVFRCEHPDCDSRWAIEKFHPHMSVCNLHDFRTIVVPEATVPK